MEMSLACVREAKKAILTNSKCRGKEIHRGQIIKGFVDYGKKYGFYPRCRGKPLECFKLGSILIYRFITFLMLTLAAAVRMDCRKTRKEAERPVRTL